tara:strand:+ start:314 stop:490 length:177 start_codon:yes stop_codon:yes gene_type:complete
MSQSTEQLKEKRDQLVEQQKQAEATFHQIAGAITVVDQMLEESKGKKPAKDEKKGASA